MRDFLAASAAEGKTTSRCRFPSGAKARRTGPFVTAWLKPCPDDVRNRASGFSLLESLMAIAVLSIGVLSLAQLVPFATRTDYGARTDSTATFVAMRLMEQILAQPWSVTSFVDAEDDMGNTTADEPGNPGTGVDLTCTCATIPCGPPTGTLPGEAGALFIGGTEIINFSLAPVVGYSRTYRILNSTLADAVKVNQGRYDVRWNITCSVYGVGVANGAGLWKITVAARPVGAVPGMIAIPAHVQAVKMK